MLKQYACNLKSVAAGLGATVRHDFRVFMQTSAVIKTNLSGT